MEEVEIPFSEIAPIMRLTLVCMAALLLGVVASSYVMSDTEINETEQIHRSALVMPKIAHEEIRIQPS